MPIHYIISTNQPILQDGQCLARVQSQGTKDEKELNLPHD